MTDGQAIWLSGADLGATGWMVLKLLVTRVLGWILQVGCM